MSGLSKSRVLSARQCAKRAWLEVHRRELARYDSAALAAFKNGERVGDLAIELYGEGGGDFIEVEGRDFAPALAETDRLMAARAGTPIFEATLQHEGVLVREDVLLPIAGGGWRVVEVKSSSSVKDVYLEDCAVQAWVHRGAGHRLDAIALAHIDTAWVHPGSADARPDYRGLLVEVDLTERVMALQPSVPGWVQVAREAIEGPEPQVPVGHQCTVPYDCPFMAHCWPKDTRYPVQGLGGKKAKLGEWIRAGYRDIRDVPPSQITSETQLRIRRVTASGEPERLDEARRLVEDLAFPRYYLDFEAISTPIPPWPGTHAFQALPFQYSCHIEHADGAIGHREFLEMSGPGTTAGPMRALAEQLIRDLGGEAGDPGAGPVLTYSPFERRIINELIALYPDLAEPLGVIRERLFDLHPVVKQNYYHPDMLGSWSIKAVLPTIAHGDEDRLDYADLEGVAEGMGAVEAYLEAIQPETTPERRAEIDEQLRVYCRQDTEAMVRLVHFLGQAEA